MKKETYTIKDAAKMMGVPTSTIRYYDKEGLLPFMKRLESGYRVFTEKDIATLRIINCLKKTCPLKKSDNSATGLNRVTLLYRNGMKCF